ncbi:hypothetical protein LVD17_00305 [Fulvivirga ulvae]|uniref:hypothetical protein n=1 Tax=Fulvivirga ulvae TaxID=2904245 RepID=UPI001F23265E|nr:hypothetical protein [Fulvivirga ulvae]UII32278.1 hypothetical protein LVD17_00305 [Fulvivirga ulvae]
MKKRKEDQDRPATRRDIMELQSKMERWFKNLNSRPNTPKAYTAAKFSEITGVKYINVIEQCVRGQLRAYYNGSTWMVYESEVEKGKLINIPCRRPI